MRILLLLIFLFVTVPASASSCVIVPLKDQLHKARTIFVATVTSAKAQNKLTALPNGATYRVNYNYIVRERIKGSPRDVNVLFTNNIYRAWDSGIDIDGQETRLLPGDSVLVISSSNGDSQVTSGCSGSRPWSPSSAQLEALRAERAR
jgi:hypothetical protein